MKPSFSLKWLFVGVASIALAITALLTAQWLLGPGFWTSDVEPIAAVDVVARRLGCGLPLGVAVDHAAMVRGRDSVLYARLSGSSQAIDQLIASLPAHSCYAGGSGTFNGNGLEWCSLSKAACKERRERIPYPGFTIYVSQPHAGRVALLVRCVGHP